MKAFLSFLCTLLVLLASAIAAPPASTCERSTPAYEVLTLDYAFHAVAEAPTLAPGLIELPDVYEYRITAEGIAPRSRIYRPRYYSFRPEHQKVFSYAQYSAHRDWRSCKA